MRNKEEKIHIRQDKTNCFFGVGDEVSITCKNGDIINGVITCIDIRKETNIEHSEFHTVIDLQKLPITEDKYSAETSVWLDNISNLEVF